MPPDHAVSLCELPPHVVPLRITPIAAPSLAFELPIPRGWERTYGRATELCHLGLPVPLAVFQPPDLLALDPAGRPTIVVTATPLPFEVELEDWCRFRLAATRWMIRDASTVAMAAGRARVLTMQHGRGRRRRDTVVLHRGHGVAVHELGAAPPWASDGSGDAPPVGTHLRLQHGPAIGLVERRRVVELGATGVRFEVPASWEVHRPSPGATRRRITCDAANATLVLGARSAPVSTAAERSAALVDNLACMGFTRLDAGRFDAPRDDLRAAMHGWRGGVLVDAIGPKLRVVEVRAWCRRVGPFEVDGTLMVEPDLSRPLGWMRAIRALEIAMASASWEAIA